LLSTDGATGVGKRRASAFLFFLSNNNLKEVGMSSLKSLPGKLITLEGPDGSGKTSHVKTLADILIVAGYHVITTREPGGTPVAEKLRAMLLSRYVCAKTELLMFAAARTDHMDQVITPALNRGDVVICDRFADSTYAYQGSGRGLIPEVLEMEKFVLGDFEPDYTLFMDVTLEESQRRLAARAGDGGESTRFDKEKELFKARLFKGYQERFAQNPHRMVRIDAMPSPEGNQDFHEVAPASIPEPRLGQPRVVSGQAE
jgi:dTMP kinase